MAKTRTIKGDRFVEMISERRIKTKVRQLARQINKDYRDTIPVFIGILNGSFIFFADLVRDITVDCEIDFLKLSSYGDAKISSGNVRLLKGLNCQVEGRDIIIVEDIVDTGLSVEYIRHLIEPQNPKSLRVVTLLYKRDSVKPGTHVDYIGFTIPTDFVIGYGLDCEQRERNLRAVYRLQPKPARAAARPHEERSTTH
jgi:hypoxanthine phosphoribosyltransferase